jgi:catechol 2,3-dioxygenase-like lactoylglutathione lyase family enzyme
MRTQIVPSLLVGDMARTLHFYERLGFTVSGLEGERAGARWAEVCKGDIRFQFHTEAPVGTELRPVCSGTFYLVPADVDAWVVVLTSAGLAAEWGPEDMEYGMREVALRDPDGYLLAFAMPIEPDERNPVRGGVD